MGPPSKILVVDDTPANLRLLTRMLSIEGHTVVTASSGEQALAMLAREAPRLVLLDVIMPGLSGYEVLRAVRADPATAATPVVMITGLDSDEERARCVAAGADDVVGKPFHRSDLLVRVGNLLRMRELRDAVRASEWRLVAAEGVRARPRDELVASMSHELRTPLNAIIGFAELLHDGLVDPATPQHKEYLGDILTSGRELLGIINDLVDVARVEAGTLPLRGERVAVARVIEAVCAACRAAARARGVEVVTRVEPASIAVELDPARFELVLRNLLDGSVRLSREGARVTVRARSEGADCLCIEVEDGSPVEARPRKGEVPALPRRLVALMGGTSRLEPSVDGGSLLTVLLPCRSA